MRHRIGRIRAGDLAAALALAVFFWRALIPAGYMPDPTTGLIKLCSAQGLVTGSGDGPGDGDSPDHLGALCTFAATPAPAPPSLLVFEVPAPALLGVVEAIAPRVQRARDGPIRLLSARAPPALA